MNKLEERFEDIMLNHENMDSYDPVFNMIGASIDCAKEAKKIAIEFSKYVIKWIDVIRSGEMLNNPNINTSTLDNIIHKELFNKFIEEKYGSN